MISTPPVGHGATKEAENNTASFQTNQVISSMAPVFIVIAVVAILGNFLVVFLFVRNRSWLKKPHSNLILAMAVSDILTAICILTVPLFVHDNNVYPVPKDSDIARELYCRIVWSHYLVFSLGVTSVYTCLSLTIERWLAVGKPVFYKQHLHSKRNIALMVLLPWLAGFAFETSALIRTSGVLHPDGTTDCRWNPDTSEWSVRVAIAVVSFLGMIMIPSLLVITMYVHILVMIKRTLTRNSQDKRKLTSRSKTDFKRITVMAGVASLALIICWLPGQFYFMLGQMDYVQLDVIGHRSLNVLALSSTCLNPFIYAFWNPNYREGFKKELVWLVCWKHHKATSQTFTSHSRDNSYLMVARKTGEQQPPISDLQNS